MHYHVCLFAALCSIPTLACAQALKGIETVTLAVDLDREPDARACGISLASIDAAMRIPLSNTRLEAVKAGDAVLSANVNVVQAPNGQCAAAISVGLSRTVLLQPHVNSPRVFGTVWSNGHVLVGFPQGFGKAISEKVEDFTKQFLAAWIKDR